MTEFEKCLKSTSSIFSFLQVIQLIMSQELDGSNEEVSNEPKLIDNELLRTVGNELRIINMEQRINLKFLVRLGKTPSQALEMLQQAYGGNTMSRTRVFEWHKRFKDGREDVEDDSRSGRPLTSRTGANVERVKKLIHADSRLTVRMVASQLDMKKDSVWKIITENLGMRKVCAKMVPRQLSEDQKDRRLQVCQDLMKCLQTEPGLLRKVITGGETWIFERDPETQCQVNQSLPKKARQSGVKVMLITFFDMQGVVHSEFLPPGQTINQQIYREILWRLLCSVQEKRPQLWQDKSLLLHHDDAPAHSSLSIRQFLAKNNIAVLEQPPYSPDLAPCDFFLFLKLKGVIKGIHFEGVDAIKKALMTELNGIPVESFQQCIEAWQQRITKCVALEGGYIEG